MSVQGRLLGERDRFLDGAAARAERARKLADRPGVIGWGWYELWTDWGLLKQFGALVPVSNRLVSDIPRELFRNLVTDTGDQFYGDRAANILGSTKTLTALTNATNSVGTTSAAHGFGVGQLARLAGVTPSGYNGDWWINAIGSTTTFTIYVGTALGAGSAFGTVQSVTVPNASGMRIGTGTTAVAKNGAGAAIVTFGTGTNAAKALDSGFPTGASKGAGLGWRIQYKTTWAAGESTQNALAEVVITNEAPLSQVAGSAANSISRALLSPTVNKGASDTLAVTWNHDVLGA